MLDETGADLYSADMQGFRGKELVWDTWFPDRQDLVAGARLRTDPPVYRSARAAFVKALSLRAHLNPLVVRRRLIEQAGGFLPGLRFAEDAEFMLRLVDRTDTVLFCEKHMARYRFPESDSHSLSMQVAQRYLETLTAAQHLRVVAHSADVRRAARKIEAWTLRLLSQLLQGEGRPGAAISFALQALASAPTPGALLRVARAMLPSRRTRE
jgi:hypothetical protein